MKYRVYRTSRYRKSLKKLLKRGKDGDKLDAIVQLLARGEPLPARCRDHALTGDLAGLRDCHVENDWVLLYKVQDDMLILVLADTGTHSDLDL